MRGPRGSSLNTAFQHCAQTLLEFNGGASCIQVYVNQHDFFINNVREAPPADDTVLWVGPARPMRLLLIVYLA